MKVSTQTIQFLNHHYRSAGDPAPDGIDALVGKIGAQLGAVEAVVPFGARFDDVLIVRVVTCSDHPQADRLRVCMVDDGGRAAGVQRDEHGHVQVICGAPNVYAGMLAAWLPPGATVPSTMGTNEPFVLGNRPLRGLVSNGMLASPRELTLGDNHDGILDIDESVGPITPGTPFADAFHLRGDMVLEIENKMFTHRPDCFGYLGVAREIEGISGRPYKSPDWYRMEPQFPAVEAGPLPLEVRNELPELVPRFTAIAVRDVHVGPSPVWLQVDLARLGLRPVNNIVDYTNWYMALTGQPLHAYDYDKVKAASGGDQAVMVVRHPRSGEQITLLNGKTIQPRAEAIMIATDQRLIGVGGVMGGADTEVDATTARIIIESANFNMYSIRRTAMAHGLFTDAVTRFNKGQSPLQNLAALGKITSEICQFAGGRVASPLIDINHVPEDARRRGNIHPPVRVDASFINARLGLSLDASAMAGLLTNVECAVEVAGDTLTVTAPFWRTDIELPEDVVEEVGRLYGYQHLRQELPRRDLTPAEKDTALERKDHLRAMLAAAGANEVLTYSFVHGGLLVKTRQDPQHAFQIANALSPDLQYYRLSLTPSLLDRVHPNIKAGHSSFALFEINTVHCKRAMADGLPQENVHLGFVYAAGAKPASQEDAAGAPYYTAKRFLTHIVPDADGLLVPLANFDFADDTWGTQMCAPYEPGRSAVLVQDGLARGVVGEYRPAVRRALKLPAFAAGFEVALDLLQKRGPLVAYTPLARFPAVAQDISLRVPAALPYRDLYTTLHQAIDTQRPEHTQFRLTPLDIYQRGGGDAQTKHITFHLEIASHHRTLTDDEINTLLDTAASAANRAHQAERI